MRVMQVSVHQVIHVVAMGDGLMPTRRAMRMVLGVLAAIVLRRANRRVGTADRQAMIVHVVIVHVVEVAFVEIIRVVAVAHRLMPTPRSVPVSMAFVHPAVTLSHRVSPPGL